MGKNQRSDQERLKGVRKDSGGGIEDQKLCLEADRSSNDGVRRDRVPETGKRNDRLRSLLTIRPPLLLHDLRTEAFLGRREVHEGRPQVDHPLPREGRQDPGGEEQEDDRVHQGLLPQVRRQGTPLLIQDEEMTKVNKLKTQSTLKYIDMMHRWADSFDIKQETLLDLRKEFVVDADNIKRLLKELLSD
jgi:hypothetical protein